MRRRIGTWGGGGRGKVRGRGRGREGYSRKTDHAIIYAAATTAATAAMISADTTTISATTNSRSGVQDKDNVSNERATRLAYHQASVVLACAVRRSCDRPDQDGPRVQKSRAKRENTRVDTGAGSKRGKHEERGSKQQKDEDRLSASHVKRRAQDTFPYCS